jgi:hypothetical protein
MKKLVLVGLFVLVAAMPLSPFAAVMAAPAKWTPVTATQVGAGGVYSGIVLNEGGVFFFDLVGYGKVTLNTPSTVIIFASSSIQHGIINTKTNDGELHMKMIWTYPAVGEVQGTFDGEGKVKTTTYLYVSPSYRARVYWRSETRDWKDSYPLVHGVFLLSPRPSPFDYYQKYHISNVSNLEYFRK